MADLQLPLSVFYQGAANGLCYGLLAVGIVLIHRSSRFINFAHAQVGAFGSAILATVAVKGHLPYWVALPVGLATGAAVSAGIEVTVVRRLAKAPRLMSMIATLGIGQLLLVIAVIVNASATSGDTFPKPEGIPTFTISHYRVNPAYTLTFVLAPLAVLALTLFFRRSRYGLAIRAAAANPDAAAMAAMSPKRLTTLVWAIGGAVAALTTTLLIPTIGAAAGSSLGPSFLVRALAAGVIARMSSLPIALGVGLAIGVVENVLRLNSGYELLGTGITLTPGLVDVLLFLVVGLALLLQGKPGRREDEKGQWLAVQVWTPLPEQIRQVWSVRWLGWATAVVGAIVAVVLPQVLGYSDTFTLAVCASYALVGLSLTVITSALGQLSLGQFAVAAGGAYTALKVSDSTGSYEVGIVVAVVVGVLLSVAVGIPALRVQGLLLATATLAFALAVPNWLLKDDASPVHFGAAQQTGSVSLFGLRIDDPTSQAYMALAALGLGLLVAVNVRKSSFGRLLTAMRDNEDAARAFGVSVTRRKLQAYAVAGSLAGFGGAIFAYTQPSPIAAVYSPDVSITIVTMAVVGGLGSVAGPILGAFVAIPSISNLDNGLKATILVGWLVLILANPGGVSGVIRPVRDLLIDGLARLGGVDPEEARAGADPAVAANFTATKGLSELQLATHDQPAIGSGALMTIAGITKRYGGLTAVNDVSFEILPQEILGLVGANGAGKTTLFECLSGFVKTDEGSLTYRGKDITSWSPERRAHAGLIRSFQDSGLFSTLTVLETVLLSNERLHPSSVTSAVSGVSTSEAKRLERARDMVALVGLDRYRHTQIGSLSTGTRRIAELACMINLEPTLLLLDEPSSGIAQREVEALGVVLQRICRQLQATMVIIEHDIPLVSSLSDRMIAMETGRVLSVGTPSEVLGDPAVISSYLGGDVSTVTRSTQKITPKRKPRTKAKV